MITVRPARERGHADHGWLDSNHTFSFADYYDPKHMGFRALRVINEDRVAPGRGFGAHPHADMEIVSYVIDGALEHKDSMGTGSIIRPGDVQRMTAGTGVRHSEFNASKSEPVHFLQIWILPEAQRLKPGYEQKTFTSDDKKGRLCLVASRDGRDGSVTVHQDVALYAAVLDAGQAVAQTIAPGRHLWMQVIRGEGVSVNGKTLVAGDGAALSDEARLEVRATSASELLVFDLA
jgi:redox-sensitive bicupin YhaK (pirin superfamily)